MCVFKKLNYLLIRHLTKHLSTHVSKSLIRESADVLFSQFDGLIGDWQPYRNVNKLLADHRHVASVSEALL